MKRFLTVLLTFLLAGSMKAQYGRVVINEILPWPGNSCGTTAEFVELYNMGPGPVNIGCYIISDGDFSITIPPGTILGPGKFYVLSGQSFIPAPCANIAKDIVADLNWNTCGCTSAPIPTTGDGFMTDGGGATEQVVLLSPTGAVVDAVARGIPAEPSSLITSKSMGGLCTPKKFNLDLMGINYETIGESAGRGNSIARKLDGDCGWVKDTQQSGGATNNTPGETSDFSVSMFITEEINCTGGSATFIVNNSPASFYFPLDYILAQDIDGDGQYTFADVYTTGQDFTAPSMVVGPLPLGSYAINIGPVQGCGYKNFNFAIGPCIPLGFSLESFTAVRGQNTVFNAQLSGGDELSDIILQGSINGRDFYNITSLPFNNTATLQDLHYEMPNNEFVYFRLLMGSPDHHAKYSPVRKVSSLHSTNSFQLAGNPVSDEIKITAAVTKKETLDIQVVNSAGQVLVRRQQVAYNGENLVKIPAQALSKGLYFVKISTGNSAPQTFRVLKQ
jgi:Lamin Tail Domain/Secretion system C-terminal sorting domain